MGKDKKTVAVIFGGCSAEHEVSLRSAYAVLKNMDRSRFEVIPVGVTREGRWYHYTGSIENIPDGTWCDDPVKLTPAAFSMNRAEGGLLDFYGDRYSVIKTDLAFPVLHGKNGEDGTVQGLLELAGIPVVGCSALSSALCMDKERAHRLVSAAGISVPVSLMFRRSGADAAAEKIREEFRFPVFVKPVRGGSSFGMTKVSAPEKLDEAIQLAFLYDQEVTVEEAVDGFEVGCAVIGNEELFFGAIDEVELSCDFFDHNEKYTLSSSRIHMPARVDEKTAERIRQTAEKIYRILCCSGFARVDMFLTPEGDIVFNEVNTIPGLTSGSRFPNMMKGAGLSFPQMLDKLLGLYTE